jgi:hypothetical protein
MRSHSLTLRERSIGIGLLRPADPLEQVTAYRRCSIYLENLAATGFRYRTATDDQLAISVLEHWLERQ